MKWIRSTLAAATVAGLLTLLALPAAPAADAKSFAEDLGAAPVGDVQKTDVLQVPFIFWGGDVATFLANGGLETGKDSTFGGMGLKLKLTKGDDFLGQVKDYLAGKTPFLRGTMSQLGQAAEVLDKDPRTQPVVFLQLTWSMGDHLVAREGLKTLNDLKGKKIALQQYGPHVGFLDDELQSAGLKWSDVTVVWTPDVTGPKGPAEAFRADKTIDACFVVTPDMADLTGGLKAVGTGADKTVKGAHVLDSTQYKNHSIVDVYACRKDWFDKNRETAEKFAAGYLKACEDLVDLKDNHDSKTRDADKEKKYSALLKLSQDVWGKDVLPGLDDVHGLIKDATFVGLPGNYKFFTDKEDVIGFQGRMKAAGAMAVNVGSAKAPATMLDAGLDFDKIKTLGSLKLAVKAEAAELGNVDLSTLDVDKDAIFSFTVEFDVDSTKVDTQKYAKEFQKAVDEASKYGHAVFAVRGHVDPTKTLVDFVKAGMAKGILQRTGEAGNYKYFLVKEGKAIDLADTKDVLRVINSADFSGADQDPKATVAAAQTLSDDRAKAFREAVIQFAKAKNLRLDESQFKSQGVGIAEPIIGKPKNDEDASKNRRVEFRILKVSPEVVKKKDFTDI
ncbi:MAG TPA: ABC transporter substrate-binding protein [Gemmataceae bacterium]|nr:ABC transporter substrate-binding protein [Gemmataceae bacterium]